MVIVLIGLAIVAIPVALAFRTVFRLLHRLGAVDGVEISRAIAREELELDALCDALAREAPGSVAERVLRAALRSDASRALRELAVAEEVADVERNLMSDARVPRVAASLATTGGLLAAALVMRDGLGVVVPEGADPMPIYFAVIERGLTLAGVAVFGGIACATLHRAAQRERRARLGELDAMTAALTRRLFGSDE